MSTQRSLFNQLARYLRREPVNCSPMPPGPVTVPAEGVRLPFADDILEVELGTQRLWLYAERALSPAPTARPHNMLVFDPERYLSGPGSFLRLTPGQSCRIHPNEEGQQHLLSQPHEAMARKLEILHEGETVVLREPTPDLATRASSLADGSVDPDPIAARRKRALDLVIRTYGGPLEPLASEAAHELLNEVNQILESEPFRSGAATGTPAA